MKNYVQKGDVMPLPAPYAVAAGAGFLVGSAFAVATSAAGNGEAVEGATTGVYDLAKVSAQAWTVGAKIYWDNSAKLCTTTSSGNTLIGWAAAAAADPSATGRVRLNGSVS